jgi:hypothetical protein
MTHSRSRFLVLILMLALSVFAWSCSSTETTNTTDGDSTDGDTTDGDFDEDGEIPVVLDGDKDDTDQPLPDGDEPDGDEPDGDTVTDGDTPVDGDADEYEVPEDANAYRLNALELIQPMMAITTPISMDVTARLNEQLTSRIGNYQINIILRPEGNDVLDFPYVMMFLVAEKEGSEYISDPSNSYTMQVIAGEEANEFTTQNDFQIEIPITDDQNFVIRKAQVSGTYSEDLGTISDGVIAGVVHEDDANSTVVYETNGQQFTLAQVFFALGVQPDYNFEDNKKGYTFIFTFTAQGIVNIIREPDGDQ